MRRFESTTTTYIDFDADIKWIISAVRILTFSDQSCIRYSKYMNTGRKTLWCAVYTIIIRAYNIKVLNVMKKFYTNWSNESNVKVSNISWFLLFLLMQWSTIIIDKFQIDCALPIRLSRKCCADRMITHMNKNKKIFTQ